MNGTAEAVRPAAGHPDRDFELRMLIARCRWLLTLEARGIAARLLADNSFHVQLLRDELLLTVARSNPRSRLIPWHLTDRVVERIIKVVVADLVESWI